MVLLAALLAGSAVGADPAPIEIEIVESPPGAQSVPIKKLYFGGKTYAEASAARGRADLMLADFERRFKFPPPPIVAPKRDKASQDQADAEAAKVVRALWEVIDRYPHTEFAAYCTLRLAGFYEYLQQSDKAIKLMEQMATEFAGTSLGNEAILGIGETYADARHEPAEAIKWFSRVPKPDASAGDDYGKQQKLYLSAQQQLVKCELELHHDAEAKDRAKKYEDANPQLSNEMDRFAKFEIDARKRPTTPVQNQQPAPAGRRNRISSLPFLAGTLIVLIAVFIFRRIRRRRTL